MHIAMAGIVSVARARNQFRDRVLRRSGENIRIEPHKRARLRRDVVIERVNVGTETVASYAGAACTSDFDD